MPEENDEKLNPGQSDYNRKVEFDVKGLGVNENSDESVEKNSNENIDEIKDAEENPDGEWRNNVTAGKQDATDKQKKQITSGQALIRLTKKKGPMLSIFAGLGVGAIVLNILLSPGLLLVQIKEILVERFDTQFTSMEVRNSRILKLKTSTVSSACGVNSIKLLCSYSGMSDKQIANLEKNGIKVTTDGKTITQKNKVKSFEYEGKSISATEFTKELTTNNNFKAAVRKAYNPKFAGFSDSYWKKVTSFFSISKNTKISGETDEERSKNIQEDIRNGTTSDTDIQFKQGDIGPDGEILETVDDVDAANTAAKSAAAAADEIAMEVTENGTKSAAKEVLSVASGVGTTAIHMVSLTGIADAGCLAYNTVKDIAIAAKTVRNIQLARFAMIFLSFADKIKAGDATEQEATYLGNILTASTKSSTGEMKSATDSFGYKYSAYHDIGVMPASATRFMVGGGFPGELSSVTKTINNATGGTPEKTCKFLSNWFVQGFSFILGGAALLLGEIPIIGAADIAKMVGVGALTAATAFLPALLQDIVAGVLVDETTVGEDAGDAIVSGSSGIMGTSAKFGGNAPVTAKQAAAYNDLAKNINSEYNKDNAIAVNQFDASDKNSFFGKIAAFLIPYTSKLSSLSGVINSFTSITSKSVAAIFSQSTSAEEATDPAEYSVCTDEDYSKLKIATDPYCNITYAIPVDSLELSPVEVAEFLLDYKIPSTSNNGGGSIAVPQLDKEKTYDDDTSRIGAFPNFVNTCINRTRPLFESTYDKDGVVNNDGGSECIFNDSKGEEITSSKTTCGDIVTGSTNFEGAPSLGSILINTFDTSKSENGCTTITRHWWYIGNGYYYLYYIDQRVEKGIDSQGLAS